MYAGTRSISKAFENRGHEVFTVEWDKQHSNIDWYADMLDVTAEEILKRFGKPDVIWASPPCEKFSVAAIGKHWHKGTNEPKTEETAEALRLLEHTVQLIKKLDPEYYFIENPRGKMRKMDVMQDLPRHTVTYCQYGDERMKPTDLWTNHPNPDFKAPCKNGMSCHVSAPRGSRTGTQGIKGAVDRSRIPDKLCQYIVDITTTYKLIDINDHEDELVSEGETLTSLKDFVNRVFDYDEVFSTTGLTFTELQGRLEGIGYSAEERHRDRECKNIHEKGEFTMSNELIKKVQKWSEDKGLDHGDSSRQFLKLIEEIGEVADALAKDKREELIDGLGDTLVVLIILAQQQDLDLMECLEVAYNEIADRTGKTVDGVFIKDE